MSLSKKICIKICFFSLFSIKWNKKSWVLVKIGLNKNSFHKWKKPISVNKADIKKIVLSSKESYGNKGAFKYFIEYISNVGITPLNIWIGIKDILIF